MKRFLISLLLALPLSAAIPTQAQTQEQHMEFMGIPMKGTINAFAQKLQAKGMKITDREDNIITLSGTFAGANDCYIDILETPKKEIWRVGVSSFNYTWETLSGRYFRWKEMLTQKYGEPLTCTEEFQTTYPPDSDAMRWHYVNSRKCNYRSTFLAENGYIILTIMKIRYNKNYVSISYTDWINEQKMEDSAMDDL